MFKFTHYLRLNGKNIETLDLARSVTGTQKFKDETAAAKHFREEFQRIDADDALRVEYVDAATLVITARQPEGA